MAAKSHFDRHEATRARAEFARRLHDACLRARHADDKPSRMKPCACLHGHIILAYYPRISRQPDARRQMTPCRFLDDIESRVYISIIHRSRFCLHDDAIIFFSITTGFICASNYAPPRRHLYFHLRRRSRQAARRRRLMPRLRRRYIEKSFSMRHFRRRRRAEAKSF